MRLATKALAGLFLVSFLAACAAGPITLTPEQQAVIAAERGFPSHASRARDARADSILALPTGQMTEADSRWLQVYYAERQQRDREAQTAEVRQARQDANTWVVLSLVGSAILGIVSYIAYSSALSGY